MIPNRTSTKRLYAKLDGIAKHLSSILNSLDAQNDLSNVQRFYDKYKKYFIEEYSVIGAHVQVGMKRGSLAMHIFVELSRAHFILKYEQLMNEKQMIIHGSKGAHLIQAFSLKNCKTEFWHSDNDKSIFMYNQNEIIALLLLLSRRIVEMPFEQTAIMDFRQILLSLYTRNCVFFCQTCSSAALNVEDMRVLHPNGEFMFNRDYACFVLFISTNCSVEYTIMMN